MFRLLAKESNIFSLPVYIVLLLGILLAGGLINLSLPGWPVLMVSFLAMALGYLCILRMNLTYGAHLPLVLYTLLIICFYEGNMGIGLAVTLLCNGILLLLLTNPDVSAVSHNYTLIGAILGLNFIFLPAMWPMSLFVLLHLFATSPNIGQDIFRMGFGEVLVAAAYFCVMYFFGANTWDSRYLPMPTGLDFDSWREYAGLILLGIFAVLAVADHFLNYNKKSPVSRYKYTFVLVFGLSQLVTVGLYAGSHHDYFLLLALPLSVIFARYLWHLPRPWMRSVGLLLLAVILLGHRLFNF